LLEGIKSEQERLLALARSMAEAFSREFQSRLTIAVDAPVRAAEAARDRAAAAVPNIQQMDLLALGKIRGLIDNAEKWLTRNLSVFERIRTEDILEIYRGLEADIRAFRPIDVSGIRAGMTVDELTQAARAAGGTTVNNFYLETYAGLGADGTQIGQQIVNEILKYERSSGTVFQRAE